MTRGPQDAWQVLKPPTRLLPDVAVILSLGYDMTQPLFGGIITALGRQRAGQAMGLNSVTLFAGGAEC
jgi:hypothetical protein